MPEFILDPVLSRDCFLIKETRHSLVLLMNNSLYHWFIIVPRENAIEWFELEDKTQLAVMSEINLLSRWIKTGLVADKINIATIGNIVSQLHIHVIGRRYTDSVWPAVVWGSAENKPYTEDELKRIKLLFEVDVKLSLPEL